MNPSLLIKASFRRYKYISLAFVILIAVAAAFSIIISIQERLMRQTSAAVTNQFDVIIGASGSKTDLLLATAFLQSKSLNLIPTEQMIDILAEDGLDFAAPIAFGDSYKSSPIIGTIAPFINHLSKDKLLEGKIFTTHEHAVIGANVKLKVGDVITPTHGEAMPEDEHHDEDEDEEHHEDEGAHNHEHVGSELTIVGRMQATATAWDNAIIIPIEMMWEIHGLANGHSEANEENIGLPFDNEYLTEASVMVLKPKSIAAAYRLRSEYDEHQTTAFFPAEIMAEFYMLMGDARQILTLMGYIVEALVIISILIGISIMFQLFSRQFAILRALGAPRLYIYLAIWGYIMSIVVVGIISGLLLAYGTSFLINDYIQSRVNISIVTSLSAAEIWMMLMALIIAAILAFFAPLAMMQQSITKQLARG
ncbi:MAG: FtsX-like permease family protein [Alphaproteobacteria bacterium]|nr:FtsX-like permease family protein [Alphaproteobacteria bacterium]